MNHVTRAVSFDFDGVFPPNSDAVHKPTAYQQVLQKWANHESALQDAKTHFGYGRRGGRREILEHVFKYLGEPDARIPSLVERASYDFDAYVQKKILEDGLTIGSLEALGELSALKIPLYLNSGTATPALVQSSQNLGIAQFFAGILGSTPEPIGGSKVENLKYTAEREEIKPSEMLMVGDGDSDRKAAEEFGCRFLGFANKWNKWAESKQKFDVVSDLREVVHFL